MRFIPLQKICEIVGFTKDLSNPEHVQLLIETIEKNKGTSFIYNDTIVSEEEIDQIISSLQNQNTLIFHSWIQLNKPLIHFLTNGIPSKPFSDTGNHLSHQLGNDYKKFLSPSISSLVLKYEDSTDLTLLSNAFSFVSLLNSDYRPLIEARICSKVIDRLTELVKKGASSQNEQDLTQVVTPLCADEVIRVINQLSRTSYALKVKYVDQVLAIIHLNACTVRLANWLLKQVQKIELNAEHSAEIKEVHKNLAEGKINIKNRAKSKSIGISGRQILTWCFIALLGYGTYYVTNYKQVEDQEELSSDSSFTQFTKGERQKIDSLLRAVQKRQLTDDESIDQGGPIIGQSAVIVSRTPFYNQRMEQLYQDYRIDANLNENGVIDSCAVFDSKAEKSARYNGVKDLLKRKGSQDVLVKNDSEYDAMFIVFDNRRGGKVYSTLIKKNQLSSFKINVTDHIICIPGNELGKFIAPTIKQTELPSKNFDHHFCSVDENYQYAISTTYEFTANQSGKVKFMITGVKNSYYQLLDINGVLITK